MKVESSNDSLAPIPETNHDPISSEGISDDKTMLSSDEESDDIVNSENHAERAEKDISEEGSKDVEMTTDNVPGKMDKLDKTTTQMLPEGFITAAAHFQDQITHGTTQELSIERLKFEIPLDKQEVDDVLIHTKALVILGRLVNEDPSRKVVAFKVADEKYWKPLAKTHDIPQTMESMRKYIADPMVNPKTNQLIFHMRFTTAKPLRMMKRNSLFMTWLKKEHIWLSVNQITSTNNKRVGLFIGKNAYVTNLGAFTNFVHKKLSQDRAEVPDFQISIDGVGDTKDSTRSKALVVICAAEDISILRDNLLQHFSLKTAFPFMPFKAMHLLPPEIQRTYYHRQRQDTHGSDLIEIPIPGFDGLDLPSNHPSSMTLRNYVFSMSSDTIPIRIDIDNGTKSQDTVFRVTRSAKEDAKNRIAQWLNRYMNVNIVWSLDKVQLSFI